MRRPALLLAAAGALIALVAGGAALASLTHALSPGAAESAAVRIARTALPVTARDLHGEPGGELLSVDPRGDGSAQVLLYDYATDRAHQVTVESGAVATDRSAARTQPPPSADETATAFGIALHASRPLSFVTTFARQQGVPLVSADQVQVEADVWVAPRTGSADAASAPRAPRGASVCGVHRCVRLVISTAAGDYLDTSDFVVDLSADRVFRARRS